MMTEKEAQAFMKKVDGSAPFWQELHDQDRPMIKVQSHDVPRCLYNLMVARRDVNLYHKGISPRLGWKIEDVKEYFGLKGGKQQVTDAINAMHSEFIGRSDEQGDRSERQTG